MPHFSFLLHIILVKAEEKPVHMSRRVLDIYMSTYVQLAYHMAESYIKKGWAIKSIQMEDFIFLGYDSLTWPD
jgi:hypothetical protein